jgi:hypothetical protein
MLNLAKNKPYRRKTEHSVDFERSEAVQQKLSILFYSHFKLVQEFLAKFSTAFFIFWVRFYSFDIIGSTCLA